ncbi:MAG: hypothetical protein FWB98_06445 [Defluviitaleaceae bacterium]|nr:hypothetical protein [Defluviitaleaceae bacterium]
MTLIKRIFMGACVLLALVLAGCNDDNSAASLDDDDYAAYVDTYDNIRRAQASELLREEYTALLRQYAEVSFYDFGYIHDYMEWEWFFILHDIDLDDFPELLIKKQRHSGPSGFFAVYTFRDNVAVALEFYQTWVTDVSASAPPNNNPGVILNFFVGSSIMSYLMVIEGESLVVDTAGHLRMVNEENTFTINDGFVTEIEYNYIFGIAPESDWLIPIKISETNIQTVFNP